MWFITQVNTPQGTSFAIYGPQGKMGLNVACGGQGTPYVVTVPTLGYLTLLDTGNTHAGPAEYSVEVNGRTLWFYDSPKANLSISVDSGGKVTLSGALGTETETMLHPLPGMGVVGDRNGGMLVVIPT